MKAFLKKFIPESALKAYHYLAGRIGAILYGSPSEKLIVIGVTGTNGKTTVVNLIGRILQEAGKKVAFTSTINFHVDKQEWLNPLKMTMPGRFFLQRFLHRAVKDGCEYAVIESSSEGVLQSRHRSIHYDVMVFTNLAPEHLERHGGFQNYKAAKLEYFKLLERSPHKILNDKQVPKVIVVNAESKFRSEFLDFQVDQKWAFSFYQSRAKPIPGCETLRAEDIRLTMRKTGFKLRGVDFQTPLMGPFNVENSLAAIAVCLSQGVTLQVCQKALSQIEQIPGRLEFIREGQPFEILVDYAPEPNSLRALYRTIAIWPKHRLIHILGSTGGGRDRSRRAILGRIAGEIADIVIVTNEDPYDEDPEQIINAVAAGAVAAGKTEGVNLFRILDRRAGIGKALALAKENDLVVITGKGAEQAIVGRGGKKIPWDDRVVVREELKKAAKSF